MKNEKDYEKAVNADAKGVKKGLKNVRAGVSGREKVATSFALGPRFVVDLKEAASAWGVPYQTLMPMFFVEGFQRRNK